MAIAVFERWGLNPREQRVATIALFVLGVFVILAVPVGLSMLVSSRRTENAELRDTLTAVNGARGKLRESQDRRAELVRRYGKKAPALAGFLEQSASQNGLKLTDSQDRPDTPHGKRYVERHTIAHVKKAGMGPIAKFVEAIEKSGYPVAVTRLNIHKRSGEPDSYDVEIGVSAYDRNEPAPAAAAADKDKDKDKK